jgi:hypothetical protein
MDAGACKKALGTCHALIVAAFTLAAKIRIWEVPAWSALIGLGFSTL